MLAKLRLTSSFEDRLEAGTHAETAKVTKTVKTNFIKSDRPLMKRREERRRKGETRREGRKEG